MSIIKNDLTSNMLADDLLDEAIEVLRDFVFNEEPEEEFVKELLKRNPELLIQAEEKSFRDTSVRERLMRECSQLLIGKPWLKDTDGWLDDVYEEFEADVLAAYEDWCDENLTY
jgi:hypothetical protein